MTDKEIKKALEYYQSIEIIKLGLNLINRQQAEIERLNVELVGMRGACNSYKMHYDNAKAEIERLNNEMDCRDFKNEADVVEVKHGRWETRSFIIFDSEKVGYRCSECKTTWDTETNYCPNCGSDMRKEGEGK